MITIDKYIKNPTRVLPTTYNESKITAPAKGEIVLSDDEYHENDYTLYDDNIVFRMKHDLTFLKSDKIPRSLVFKTFSKNETFAKKCLEDDLYNLNRDIFNGNDEDFDKMYNLITDKGYDSLLCFFLYTSKRYKSGLNRRPKYPIGFCVASIDKNIKEGTIVKIGLINEFATERFAKLLLQEVIFRFYNLDVDFVTASIKNNEEVFNLDLFTKCGFTNAYAWHYLRKQNKVTEA